MRKTNGNSFDNEDNDEMIRLGAKDSGDKKSNFGSQPQRDHQH